MSKDNNLTDQLFGWVIIISISLLGLQILFSVVGAIDNGPIDLKTEWGSHPGRSIWTGNDYDRYENIDPDIQDAFEKAANKKGQSIYGEYKNN